MAIYLEKKLTGDGVISRNSAVLITSASYFGILLYE